MSNAKRRVTRAVNTDDVADHAASKSGEPIDANLPHGAVLNVIGLTLPANLDFDQWRDVGSKLRIIDTSVQWAIADWWAHAEKVGYGKRKAVAEKLGYVSSETLMNYASIARRFTTSLRSELLSFSHHATIPAKLEPVDQQEWLKKAANGKWTVKKLREEIERNSISLVPDAPPERLEDVEAKEGPARQTIRNVESIVRKIHHAYPPTAWLSEDLSVPDIEEIIAATSPLSKEWDQFRISLEDKRDQLANAT